jgi:hypothetical protein
MPAASLYDTDYYAWTLDQTAALRELALKRPELPLDLLRLAGEIEGLNHVQFEKHGFCEPASYL